MAAIGAGGVGAPGLARGGRGGGDAGWPRSGFGAYLGPRIAERAGLLRVARDSARASVAESRFGAELLRWVFKLEVEVGPRCGGQARILGFVTEPQVVRRILGHLERREVDARAGPWAGAATAPG